MIEQLLLKLLEQTPIIIVLCIGIYDFRNKVSAKEKEAISERKAHKKEMKELVESHKLETKELNQLVRDHEKEHLEALDGLTDALEKIN